LDSHRFEIAGLDIKEIEWYLKDDFEFIRDDYGKVTKIIALNDQGGIYLEVEIKETLGKGRFCKVKRVLGHYEEENAKNIPYAIKIFEKSLLKAIKINTMDGMSNMLVKTDSEIKL
jgi:hypothetical protein